VCQRWRTDRDRWAGERAGSFSVACLLPFRQAVSSSCMAHGLTSTVWPSNPHNCSTTPSGIRYWNWTLNSLSTYLLEHYLITFEFLLLDYTPQGKNVFARSDHTVSKFKEVILSALISMSLLNIIEDSYANYGLCQLHHLDDGAAGSLWMTLHSFIPQKKKIIKLPNPQIKEHIVNILVTVSKHYHGYHSWWLM